MLKRGLWIVLCLLMIGIVLVVQAQDDPPLSPATVNAAVSTLIAQTQQPQILATQTIQAALAQALTATAVAQTAPGAASTAAVQAFDVSKLTVGGTTNIDLLAGPTGKAAYLAPDGIHFAYYMPPSLCIYQNDQQQTCTDLSTTTKRIDTESIRWSPDSRYLAFTEEFFRTFTEPDIWVFDTTTAKATDITDDGITKVDISTSDWKNIDVFPRWTSDNQIIFLRYARVSGQILPPEIHRISLDGSSDTLLGTINTVDQAFAIFSLDVGHDKLAYGFAAQTNSPSDGVWVSDLDGKNARQLNHESDTAIITNVQFSPDGRYILVNSEQKNPVLNAPPEASRMYTVDTSSGQVILIDPERFVSGAGWSPQGSALVYITHSIMDPANDPVFLTNAPGTAGQPLTSLQGHFNIATPLLRVTLTWGANNTILLSHLPGTGIVLAHLQ